MLTYESYSLIYISARLAVAGSACVGDLQCWSMLFSSR